MVTFNDVLKQICVLFSKDVREKVAPSQVGFESIKLNRDEIDYKNIDTNKLPQWVIVHMFIFDDWSGYAVVNLEQTKLYGLGTFYFDEEPFKKGR
ncbi:hypothetical protein [Lactiplantibacillus plantarum]|uniref:hypothetical protein n=1 Tax=Lactiplantibacillus plantarum TaxID=1590 RepID=UPI000A20C483|nr:hypothetical protein [Lactiplantibacillus plantarum]ARO01669.1 hypothetical protein BIZ31_12860 [Lactiplantibacillus plantarum]ARO04576.1 hypothetical protein BIZ32_12670 [Lactiplantibacillus plantarum]